MHRPASPSINQLYGSEIAFFHDLIPHVKVFDYRGKIVINQFSLPCEKNISLYLWYVIKWTSAHEFADITARNNVLRQVTAMRLSAHPSGYPDPADISMLIHCIRDEKFRIVRERGRGDSAAAEIQCLIDALKRLEAAALQARPVSVSRSHRYGEWAGLASIILMLMSPVFFGLLLYLPPTRFCVLALIVYGLLAGAAETLSQDKFSPLFAAITLAVLFVTAVGLALAFFYTAANGL